MHLPKLIPFSPTKWAGLGADQILGATIIDATGQIVEANEKILKLLRGGGCSYGVVVELKIRVFPGEPVRFQGPHP